MDKSVSVENKLNIDKSTWQLTKLGDLAAEISSRVDNPAKSKYQSFVGLEHFESGDLKIKNWGTTKNLTSSAKAFQKGDVLFARRNAYLRRASMVEFDGCCSGDAFVLRENHEKVVPGFLAFVMNSSALWDFANSNAAGTMSKRVKWRDLAEYEFLLPPKDQQAKLAELLWAMDEVIEKRIGLLKHCEFLFKVNQKLLLNKPDYVVKNIFEVAEVQRGKFAHRPRNAPQFYGGTIPFIQTSEVVESDKWIKNYTQTLNNLGLSISKMFNRKTIVMTIAANIGYVGMLDFDSAFTDSLVGINSFGDKLSQDYLFHYLNHKQKEIESLSTESAQKNLSLDRFKCFKVRFPESLDEQLHIVAILENIRNNREIIQSNIAFSKSLQKSLINQIFQSCPSPNSTASSVTSFTKSAA